MSEAADIQEAIWAELQRATTDRGHAWRTPVLATVDHRGRPQARTVVLREADEAKQCLTVYTDHRSPKAIELAVCREAIYVFWSSALNWQLRVATEVTVEVEGDRVQQAWDRVRHTAGAADYLSLQAPGSPLGPGEKGGAERHALGVIVSTVTSIDWLELSANGHRRALLGDGRLRWLVP